MNHAVVLRKSGISSLNKSTSSKTQRIARSILGFLHKRRNTHHKEQLLIMGVARVNGPAYSQSMGTR